MRAIGFLAVAAGLAVVAGCTEAGRNGGRAVGCAAFTVEQPSERGGAVVQAAEFGLSETNADNATAINRAIEEAKRVGAGRIVVPKGRYRCFSAAGLKFHGLKDLVFDGGGSTFVFWKKSRGDWDAAQGGPLTDGSANVDVQDCRRVRLESFKVDWDWKDHPLGFFAKVADVHVDKRDNESYVDLELVDYERYPLYPNPVPIQFTTTVSPERDNARMDLRDRRNYCGMDPGHFGCKNEWLAPNRLRAWMFVPQPGRPQNPRAKGRFSPAMNRWSCRNFEKGALYAVLHYYYGFGGMRLESNEHLTIRDVAILGCRGFGLHIEGREKHTWFDRFRLAPPDGEGRCVSSTADGTYMRRSLGYLRFTDCEWRLHNDDSINFNDRTTSARKIGERTVELVTNADTSYFAPEKGTTVELRREDFSAIGWTGRVVAFDKRTITFDRTLPEQTGLAFLLFNRDYGTANLEFRNCRFGRTLWSRGLVLGSNVTFDGCTFENLLGSPLRFQASYTYNAWSEGMGCTNVSVRNCTFRNCIGSGAYPPNEKFAQIFVGARIPGSGGWPEQKTMPVRDKTIAAALQERIDAKGAKDILPDRSIVGDIEIVGNRFVNPGGYVLHTLQAGRVEFRDNEVVFDGTQPYPLAPHAGKNLIDGQEQEQERTKR